MTCVSLRRAWLVGLELGRGSVCSRHAEGEVKQLFRWRVLALEEGRGGKGRWKREREKRLGLTAAACRLYSRGWGCVWFRHFGVVFKHCVLHDGEVLAGSSGYCGTLRRCR